MELPKLNRLPVSPNLESEEQEIFYPSWECFCCQDTGMIQPHLVRLVISDFDWDKDRIPVCSNCNVHHDLTHLLDYKVLDTRFNSGTCAELDRIAREDWSNTAKSKQRNILAKKAQQAAIELAQSKSLRKLDRTPNEDLAQHQKHQYIRENWDLDLKTEDLKNEYAN